MIYSRRFDCMILTSLKIQPFSCHLAQRSPRTRWKPCHESGPSESLAGIRHCSREDSRHLNWSGSNEPNGRRPLPCFDWKWYCLNIGIVSNGKWDSTNHLLFPWLGLLPLVPDQCFVPSLWLSGHPLGLWNTLKSWKDYPSLVGEMWSLQWPRI